LTNSTFIAGRAEDVLATAIAQHSGHGKRIVAVVDPPREGLHPKVIQALRKCKGLNTVIYISCNHGKTAIAGFFAAIQRHALATSRMDRKHNRSLRSELSEVGRNGSDASNSAHVCSLIVFCRSLSFLSEQPGTP
jgi:O-methyltransferase involved in polyketide biosynthesis